MSFHHCPIYHGSGPNRSDRPRRAISLHLQDGDNRWRPYATADGTRSSTTTTCSYADNAGGGAARLHRP